MKSRSLCFIIVIMIFSLSCKKQDNTSAANKSLVLEYITKTNALKDTLINDINIEKTENIKNEDREKIIQLYFSSFQKDDIEPNIAFDEVKKDHSKIEVKKYVTLNINKNTYPSYLLSFPYENDEIYRALLLTNKEVNDGVIIYEKVVDEGEYLRISKIRNNKIQNFLYHIEYYNYDKDGNIMSNKKQKDSILLKTNSFIIIKSSFKKEKKADLKLSEKWYGKYNFTIDENSEDWRAIQDVTLLIKSDSILFHVEGYQIAQDYKLKITDTKDNQIKLFYDSPVYEGDESAVLQKTKNFGTIVFDGKKYTWNCPYIDESFTNGKKNIYILKKEN